MQPAPYRLLALRFFTLHLGWTDSRIVMIPVVFHRVINCDYVVDAKVVPRGGQQQFP